MKNYLVGGALRDALLGQPSKDRDWVVVDSTSEKMLQMGFLPIGRDFPIFLHPVSKEEYALARTERKSAPGYRGFIVHANPSVTLEEDLARRDITINAIALPESLANTQLLSDTQALWACPEVQDPFDGCGDLKAKVIRHITDAFKEDPVRILRIARFSAKLPDFSVAESTLDLMRQMVETNEVDHLVAERIWQEIANGLMQKKPSKMFELLRKIGGLKRIAPEIDALWGVPQRADYHPEIDCGIHTMMALDYAASSYMPLDVRLAVLCHDLGKATTPADILPRHIGHEDRSLILVKQLVKRLRVPTECAELAQVVAKEHGNIHASSTFGAKALLRMLHRCDALRKPARFYKILDACLCDARGRLGFESCAYPQSDRLSGSLKAALSIPAAQLAQEAKQRHLQGKGIGEYLDEARELAIEKWLVQATI